MSESNSVCCIKAHPCKHSGTTLFFSIYEVVHFGAPELDPLCGVSEPRENIKNKVFSDRKFENTWPSRGSGPCLCAETPMRDTTVWRLGLFWVRER